MTERAADPPVTDLSRYTLATLCDDGEFALYRAEAHVGSEHPQTVLVTTPATEPAPPRRIKRLEHEFALRADLDPAWAARPLELTRHAGRLALILEDPHGNPLCCLLEDEQATGLLLHLALAMATALRGMHQRGTIHKDIKPAHVLVDTATGKAWLTGFGIASRLPRERQDPLPPETIAGTLAYMAPEQTGRMNRSIDARSDLYSLGVTFYEMFTGSLPFTASDAMELVHCHIARRPVPPGQRAPHVPAAVSMIIMKLLAKTAEERYQTAAGLEHDLGRCVGQLDALGRIDEFTLGGHDTPDRLLIPEKLYGRAREIETLLASFERVLKTGAPGLVLVSGYSGIGKSATVNELHKALVAPRGFFASGKFEQLKRDIPYATLAQALQGIVRPLLAKGEAELEPWRLALREALGQNAQLLVDLVPELRLIVGEPSAVAPLPPQDAQRRFHLVFRRFLAVFARPAHPLALFFDDLQWLDAATLDLLEDLLSHGDMRHLLLIGAYRDNEIGPGHALMRAVERIRRAGAAVQDIVLGPLVRDHVREMIADSLHCDLAAATPLADLVFQKTGGNPFFVIQFLSALAEEGLLVFDHARTQWSWNFDRIHAQGYTDNVVDLMVDKLRRLPAGTQEALQQLACLGSSAAHELLASIRDDSQEVMQRDFEEALRAGIVLPSGDSYRFLHDRVQEAAYSQIPDARRAETHLRIGRLLVVHTPSQRRDDAIFEIVHQLNRGATLITAEAERAHLSELNLVAGKRAKTSNAYASALTYFATARSALSHEEWQRRPELMFALELQQAECEFLSGETALAEVRLARLSPRATNRVDRAAVACLQMELYTTLDRSDRAIAVCLEYLGRMGIALTPHPTQDEARQEYQRITTLLGSRAIESLIDLPLMHRPDSTATLDVLAKALAPARFTDANLHALLLCRMVNISLEHGSTDASCYAYVQMASITGPRFGNYEAGFRFGRLGYEMVERHDLTRFRPRVYLSFGAFVLSRTQHPRQGRELIRRAFDCANEIGDLTYAAFSLHNLVGNLLACGDTLAEVEREAERGLAFARTARFGLVIDTVSTQLAIIRMLRGETANFGSFDSPHFDEAAFEAHLAHEPGLAFAACWYWIRKLQARFLAGDHAAALQAALNAQALRWASPASFETWEAHLYGALAHAAACDTAPPAAREGHVEAITAHHAQLLEWSVHRPENFGNRAALVGAELARLAGRELEAQRLYEQAIRSARANGFVQIEALACEMAARFYAARDFEDIAQAYFAKARHSYLRWGADGKARQLAAHHPQMAAADTGGQTLTADAARSHEPQLDMAAVVKASQALSSEILPPRLIERLMTIALQNAGADRGLLILLRQGDYRIEAAARADGEAVALQLGGADELAVPETIVRYVMRTQESVLLDDAAKKPNLFSEDPYFSAHQPRSVLCLPLVRQGVMGGMLYLENTLASHVFTPSRITLLDLLASQAAISLENTRLYADLQERELRMRRLVECNIIGIAIWNANGRILDINDAFLKLIGYEREEFISGRASWTDFVPPEWRQHDMQALQDIRTAGTAAVHEREYIHKDGHRVPVLAGGAIFEATPDEGVGFVMDLTELKGAESAARESLRRYHDVLMRLSDANRVASIGQLSASVTHEINQPLAGIAINASVSLRLLSAESPNVAGAIEAVRRTIRDADRASEVVQRLRTLYAKRPSAIEWVDLNATAREVVTLSQAEFQAVGIAPIVELADDLPLVMGDSVQLRQVLMNLVRNALDAMKDIEGRARRLVIRTQRDDDGGNRAWLGVEDNGMGLDPSRVEQVFEAFFTTKVDGMGIGLSVSRAIIESHGGRLWAAPNEGAGATFSFSIPGGDVRE